MQQMGNCLGQSADSNNLNTGVSNTPIRNKNVCKGQPLKRDKFKWKSDIPLTIFHIINKRDEFWDTAPAFEGRQEIWDALKAAVEASEKNDFELAQAIIDGASIILPLGSLSDCYDELGNRYQLPLYVLSYPSNIVSTSPKEASNVASHRSSKCIGHVKTKHTKHADYCSDQIKVHHSVHNSRPSSQEHNSKITLNLRLSTGKDFKVLADATQSVDEVKEQFAAICGYPKCRQRWYCYGKLVENSHLLSECTIPENFIVQVIVHNPCDSNLTPN